MKNDAKSFIVRIWIESTPGEEQNPTWRGVIEHVGSEERKHFHNLNSITQFISEKTGLSPAVTTVAWWRSAKTWVIDELRKLRPDHQ